MTALWGLTGGIACGKSTVSRLLEQQGATIIDADVLAREVVAPGSDGLRDIVSTFGPGVLAPDGTAARPMAPPARSTSTSTVGLPRESRISRA